MTARVDSLDSPVNRHVLARAPADLTRRRLVRLGEGINKVVYASDHWVVKRERRPIEIITLICVWKVLKSILPGKLRRRVLERPGKLIRFLRGVFEVFVLPVPRGFWLATHIGALWLWHSSREIHGQMLAETHLAGTSLMPDRVCFPPTRVKVGGWPGWLVVSEATQRVETNLQDRIADLALARRFDEIEVWLQRFLDLRTSGWKRGVFSMDPHLKNYGIIENRVVLLDAGGLTDQWLDIEKRLRSDEFDSPHERLGLEMTLRDRPDIAQRFDARWRAAASPDSVRILWPTATS